MDEKTKNILRGSWKLLKKDKRLLILSIAPAAIIGILLLGSIALLYFYHFSKKEASVGLEDFIFFFIVFVISYFVYFFFQAALIYCVDKLIKNEKFKLIGGLRAAGKHLGALSKWPFVYNGVRTGIGSAMSRAGVAGASASVVTTATWHVLTIFVVPLIVLEKLSLKKAMARSFLLFTKTWGKVVVFEFSLTWFFIVIGIGGFFLITIVSAFVFSPMVESILDPAVFIVLVWGLFVVALLIIGIVVATLREIFIVVLYNYAENNKIPSPFNEKVFKEIFKEKR